MAGVGELFQDKAPAGQQVVAVAVAANVWARYDYLWPGQFGPPKPGLRVRVPFGRGDRKRLGFVVELDRPVSDRPLKTVAELLEQAPQLDERLQRLGEWISRYYVAPPGMTLAAMVPLAVGRHAPRTETLVHLLAGPADWPRSLGPRQRRILDELHEARKQGVEELPLEQLLAHSQASRDTVGRLARRELLRLESRPQTLGRLSEDVEPDPFELNDDQKEVLAAIQDRLRGGFSVTLLHGVTGSGKTEVYLRAIREVIRAGRQAIMLVPEIALATQTLQRLARRLPRVAVLHSALTAAERAFHYEQIRDGHATTVIGPRSAVFAPARSLGLIVVDEEHESSYKQDTVPRYHGRDVAIKRAALEDVPVVLGSATPSLESLLNAQRGRYEVLRLPRRIRGLPLPALRLVELRKEITRGRIELIGRTLADKIAAALDRREQIILLMNRRGYANYVFCPSCGWRMECVDCTRAMVFHQAIGLAMCHYCQLTAELPRSCPACGKKLVLFGLGIQRIESELARKFPSAVVARMDSDTMTSPRQFRQVFDGFAAGEVDILLGTQMVAKGLDFPTVTLVGIVSADTAMAIPDFRASERTFQLIVQVAGRAGRGTSGGEVVVQTVHPDDPAIQFALRHDYEGFAAAELPLRASAGVPPHVRLVRLLVRHADPDRAQSGAEK
ncbi:MAG: hypothetical protein AMJ81_07060, partial [Phycisphaerae bacterium SM23_33]